jgi:hypothetical protein
LLEGEPLMEYVVFGLIWLSVSSIATLSGRMFRRSAVAYPVGALMSFLLFGLLIAVVTSVPALKVILEMSSFPVVSGGN